MHAAKRLLRDVTPKMINSHICPTSADRSCCRKWWSVEVLEHLIQNLGDGQGKMRTVGAPCAGNASWVDVSFGFGAVASEGGEHEGSLPPARKMPGALILEVEIQRWLAVWMWGPSAVKRIAAMIVPGESKNDEEQSGACKKYSEPVIRNRKNVISSPPMG